MWNSIKSILSFSSSSSSVPASGQPASIGGRLVEAGQASSIMTDERIRACIAHEDVEGLTQLIDAGLLVDKGRRAQSNTFLFVDFAFASGHTVFLKELIKKIDLNFNADTIFCAVERHFQDQSTIDMLTLCIDQGMDLKTNRLVRSMALTMIQSNKYPALTTFLQEQMAEAPSASVIDSSTNQPANIPVEPAPYDPESGIPPTFDANIEDLEDWDDNKK